MNDQNRHEADCARMVAAAVINAAVAEPDEASERARLEKNYGQVWDTDEMRADFEVLGFGAPVVVVRRRADGKRGRLWFQHNPRFYWGFEPG